MNFASAFISLQRGHKIRRHHWKGYWYLENNTEIVMHTWDDRDINLRCSNDILYTVSNMACDDWEIADDDGATKELD